MSNFSQCYKYKSSPEVKNWDEAELDCISNSSHLISINTQDEFDFLVSIVSPRTITWVYIILIKLNSVNNYYYIQKVGLRAYKPKSFSWIDGTTNFLKYQN